MKLGLSGKAVVIFGASRGIGLSLIRAFLEENAKVTMVARDVATLKRTAEELAAKFPKKTVYSYSADARKTDDVRLVLEETEKQLGKIDVVVANVGDGRSVAEAMPNQERFSSTWSNNFVAAETVAREAIKYLEKSNGNLLFVSSIAGVESIGAPTDYATAKAAVIALSKNLARKLAPQIRVNCIAPGNVIFPGGSWDEKMKEDPMRIEALIKTTVPMQRFGTPEEIADAAVFLCSAKASFITGGCLIVDGGQTASLH